MIRLGVIGVGNMGGEHVKNIVAGKCPEIAVTAAADRRESRRLWASQQLPNAAIFAEGMDLIGSDACDAVLIATPHYQHPELAIAALQSGKHVMCEKPAGVYALQVEDMISQADRHPELTFAMMFNQRTNCAFRKIKDMLDGGELGRLKRVNWIITDWYRTQFYYDSGAWRATWDGEGGGALLNQCPHQLDLLQWLCGLPVRVRAFCHEGKWHDIEVEDDVTAYMEFEGGATGVFVTSTADAPGTNRLEITGTLGKIVLEDNAFLTFHRLTRDERAWNAACKQGFEKPPCTAENIPLDGQNPQHVGVLNAFAGHILRGDALIADGREGLRGLALSNAMHLSSWLGKPVDVPVDGRLFLDELNKRRLTSRKKDAPDITLDSKGSFGAGNDADGCAGAVRS